MTTLKQGDLIKDKSGVTTKIMGVCGGVVHIAHYSDPDKYGYATDEKSLKEYGYTWDTPAWEPEISKLFWYISAAGLPTSEVWRKDDLDYACKNFLGIYQTEELCEAAILEIKRKLGK